ncbi:MAG TPA: hypothetical protein VHW60_17725 [Caulobacteraceae bacterium]|jgi:hypothetical protein|nr:hypothetical protein [Caulobacteraceae bacterium]
MSASRQPTPEASRSPWQIAAHAVGAMPLDERTRFVEDCVRQLPVNVVVALYRRQYEPAVARWRTEQSEVLGTILSSIDPACDSAPRGAGLVMKQLRIYTSKKRGALGPWWRERLMDLPEDARHVALHRAMKLFDEELPSPRTIDRRLARYLKDLCRPQTRFAAESSGVKMASHGKRGGEDA